jgi:hypothetical protein
MFAENVYDTKEKDKREDLKKEGKHIYKNKAGYFSRHIDQDVGQKTDELRLIS